MSHETRGDAEFIVGNGKRILINSPKIRYTPEQRLADMDADGTDVQVVSIHTPLFPLPLGHGGGDPGVPGGQRRNRRHDATLARPLSPAWPLCPCRTLTPPSPSWSAPSKSWALRGPSMDMVVNGLNWDEPQFLPLFKAAESLDALLFFHPQPQDNLVATDRTLKYGPAQQRGRGYGRRLDGGNPDLRRHPGRVSQPPGVHRPHGGGWGLLRHGPGGSRLGRCVRRRGVNIQKPPSAYQNRIYYDFLTSSEAGLRFLIDTVGADRVVIGSDWPFVGWNPSPGGWLEGLQSLSQEEKEKVSHKNLEALLGI